MFYDAIQRHVISCNVVPSGQICLVKKYFVKSQSDDWEWVDLKSPKLKSKLKDSEVTGRTKADSNSYLIGSKN